MTELEAGTETPPTVEDVIAAYNRWERSHGTLYGLAPRTSGAHSAGEDRPDGADELDGVAGAAADTLTEAAEPADMRSVAAHLAHLPDHVAATCLTSHAALLRQAWVDPDALRTRIVRGYANVRCLIGLGVDPDDAIDYLPLNDTHALTTVSGVPQHELVASLRPDIETAMASQLPDNLTRAARAKQRTVDLELTLEFLRSQVATVTGQDKPAPPRRPRRPRWLRRHRSA